MGWNLKDIASGGLTKLVDDELSDRIGEGFLSPLTGGLSDVYYGARKYKEEEGPWYNKLAAGVDRGLDVGGGIDYSLRKAGDQWIPDKWKSYLQPAGSLIGGVVGSYIPVVGTAIGAAAGSMVGSKLGGEGYADSAIKAGMTYAGAKGGQLLSNGMSPASNAYMQSPEYIDPGLLGNDVAAQNVGQSLTDQVIEGGTTVAKELAKKAAKQYALQLATQAIVGDIPTYTPQVTPVINQNYSAVPITKGSEMTPAQSGLMDDSQVQFADSRSAFKPSEYVDAYASEEEKKRKEAELRRLLTNYAFQPKEYLGKYLS